MRRAAILGARLSPIGGAGEMWWMTKSIRLCSALVVPILLCGKCNHGLHGLRTIHLRWLSPALQRTKAPDRHVLFFGIRFILVHRFTVTYGTFFPMYGKSSLNFFPFIGDQGSKK